MNNDNRKLKKALHLMSQKELNGLIIYSDGTNNILFPSYFHYFSGVNKLSLDQFLKTEHNAAEKYQ